MRQAPYLNASLFSVYLDRLSPLLNDPLRSPALDGQTYPLPPAGGYSLKTANLS